MTEKDVVATGEGFELKYGTVMKVRDFLDSRSPYRTTDELYIKETLKMKLFAMEAEALKLESASAGAAAEEGEARALWMRANQYLRHVLDGYPLDELAVISYYRAHPDKYSGEDLDAGLRERIRKIILSAKTKQVAAESFKELSQKYKVDIMNLKKTESGDS